MSTRARHWLRRRGQCCATEAKAAGLRGIRDHTLRGGSGTRARIHGPVLGGDIEGEIPQYLEQERFDCLIFSHVLEHLRNPAEVVARLSRLLRTGGRVVIAVPNVLFFKVRLQFLRGDFEYDPDGGILDDTHLHFYTHRTADRYLLAGVSRSARDDEDGL